MSLGSTRDESGNETAASNPVVPAMPASTDPTERHWPPLLITPHFALSEFNQPAGYGEPATPYPEALIEFRLVRLCKLLEIIRDEVKRPIVIRCGYRSPRYNEAKRQFELREYGRTGVAEFSQHMRGQAADIEVSGLDAHELHALILRMYKEGKLEDLGGLGRYSAFVHVDIRAHLPGDLAQWDE